MRNVKLLVSYDGGAYAGWQVQDKSPTIQGKLEESLSKIAGHAVSLRGSGRTDAGVHAAAQAANFRTGSAAPLKAFVRGANSLLPPDISVLSAEEAAPDFDARKSSLYKVYLYRIKNAEARSAGTAGTSLWIAQELDVAAMDQAAGKLTGRHDFGSFRSSGCDSAHAVRFLNSVRVTKAGGSTLEIEVVGKGFLRNMVRIIAGTLIEVGLGKLNPMEFRAVIDSADRETAGPTAPAHGLTLLRVVYPASDGPRYP